MKFPGRVLQGWFGGWVGSVLAVLLGIVFLNPYVGGGLRRLSFDLPFSFQLPVPPDDVVIVSLDAESHQRLEQDYGVPWSPELHGRVVELLRQAGAALIVFDILFQERRTVDYAPLASAMRTNGGVIIGSSLRPRSSTNGLLGYVVDLPPPALLSAALTNGVVEVVPCSDMTVRRLLPLFHGPGTGPGDKTRTNHPTLAWVAAASQGAGQAWRADAPPQNWYLNYQGPPGTIERLGYWRVLSNAYDGTFSNRVVFIGEKHGALFTGSDAAAPDTFSSPYPRGSRFDGVEVHATAFLNLLRGEWLTELGAFPTFLLIVASGVAMGMLLVRLRPLWGLAAAIGLGLAVTALACALHAWARVWFPWAIIVIVQIPAALLWGVIFHATKSYIQSSFLERSLALYLSPRQVGHLLQHPELLRPGGQEQPVSIMYSDLADFSKMAERMDAASLLNWLNQYYEQAIACVHRQDGTVLNLIGDAVFALWNAPQPQADHVARACEAAFQLNEKARFIDAMSPGLPVRTRIGLHTGTACVGNLGSPDHFDYTAIGEAVNLTARLEGLNKHLGTAILATRDFVRGIEKPVVSRPVGHFRFKGFDRVTEVHELLQFGSSVDPATAPWCERFAQGLFHFRRRAWEAAEAAFQETRRLRGEDRTSQFYLEQIAELRTHPPPSGWAGEIHLTEK